MNNYEEQTTVERRGGLFSSLGEPRSLRHLEKFIEDAGLTPDEAKEWFEPYLLERRSRARSADFARDLARKLEQFFRYYDPVPVEEQDGFITVSVNELHCPRVEGATAKLTAKAKAGRKETCGIKIFGIGGGDEFFVAVQAKEVLETEANCVATIHMIEAVFERCEMNTPDSRKVSFIRLKEVRPQNLITKGRVLKDDDACMAFQLDPNMPGDAETVEISEFPSAKLTKGLMLEYGSKASSSSGVKLEKLGGEVMAQYEVTKSYETELEYSLVEGYRYVALKPSGRASWLWRWTRGA
jgi:hypothetical protein